MASIDPQIEQSWKEILRPEFDTTYFRQLRDFLHREKREQTVYPPGQQIFAAFDNTPFDNVKVVILGQDPYHGPGQANGLAFSVSRSVASPPSLQNIFKELHSDVGATIPKHGDLTAWSQQGVMLLNTVLTVRHRSPRSHRQQGWETFTNRVIELLSGQKDKLVFMLWGRFAQSKKELINTEKHLVLEAPHPSPYSANSGFFGCRHFSKANEFLQQNHLDPIKWQL